MVEYEDVTTDEELEVEKEVKITVNYVHGEDNKESSVAVIEGHIKSIGELRPLIEEYHMVPVEAQILQDDYTIIRNDGTRIDSLSGFHEDQEATITLYRKINPREVTIHVDFDGNPFRDMELTVLSTVLVSELKEMIDEREGVSPHRQRLTFGMASELLDDDCLDEYITGAAEVTVFRLYVIPRRQEDTIRLRLELGYGPLKQLSMDKNDTIFNLKGDVRRAGWVDDGDFYVSLVRDEEDAKILVGPMTLDECGIANGSTVIVEEVG